MKPLSTDTRFSPALDFALNLEEQQRSVFAYRYSVFQTEYSRKLLFRSGRQMHEVVQALIDRTRGRLYLDRVKAISGDQKRPHCERRKQKPNRGGVVIETPRV